MIGSPSNLEVLLHCFYSPAPHPRFNAPAIKEGVEYLLKNGMIFHHQGDVYRSTEKGDAFINHLMSIPFPVAQWTIPTGSK